MPVKIKICGITRYEDAKIAVNLGVDALGFIFYKKSPRYISPKDAFQIIKKLPAFVSKVGVFVDSSADEIMSVVNTARIDTIQLHGSESPEFAQSFPLSVIKAFSVMPGWDPSVLEHYDISGYLLDTWDKDQKGGTGKTFDWTSAQKAVDLKKNIILAGGLGPVNIEDALENVAPYAVDISSGVEIKPGIKNPYKMQELIKIVKAWN